MRRISQEEEARRRELHRRGLSDGEMAEECGCSISSARRWRISWGLPPNRPKKPAFRQAKAGRIDVLASEEEQRRSAKKRAEGMQALEREAAGAREQGLSYGKWRAMAGGKDE